MFEDRARAGLLLADRLQSLTGDRMLVLGLPRGGVPVAAEVARVLRAPLDVIVVRKLGIPDQPEVAMGAVGEGGVRVVDWAVVSMARVSANEVRDAIRRESREVVERSRRFRSARPQLDLEDRDVVIVDDGIATGSTMLAAVRVAREMGARSVTVAAPVAPREVASRLRAEADRVVVLETPERFLAVGQAYLDFGEVEDADVTRILGERSVARSYVDVVGVVEDLRAGLTVNGEPAEQDIGPAA